MAKTYEGLKADANTIRNEVEAGKNTAERVGAMFAEIIDKISADINAISENVTIHSGGVINLTSNATGQISKKMNEVAEDNIVIFVIGDSSGNYPSLTGETRVNADSALSVATNYFFSTEPKGANVGDLLFVVKRKIALISRISCKIIPLNDAKPASGDWYGTEGIMTVWDKTQVNKIPNLLPRAEQMPSRWTSNMNDALQTGVYVWCTLGRPSGSTGAFTCVVFRTSTNDGSYDTIEQTAYGREGELGQVWKRIIFEKKDGSDTQFHDWVRMDDGNALAHIAFLTEMLNSTFADYTSKLNVINEEIKRIDNVIDENFQTYDADINNLKDSTEENAKDIADIRIDVSPLFAAGGTMTGTLYLLVQSVLHAGGASVACLPMAESTNKVVLERSIITYYGSGLTARRECAIVTYNGGTLTTSEVRTHNYNLP